MEQLKSIIKNDILTNTESLNGFSIFKYDNTTFDIYIPTKTIEAFYFISYINGNFFDIYQNQIQLSEINTCKYSSVKIIEKNYLRILHYSDIYIKEHDMLNCREYESPRETGAEEYLDIGYDAFENEDYERAYKYYCLAINLKPYDHSFYTKRASCFIKSKQYKSAIADICRSGISNPVSKQNIFNFTYQDIGHIYRIANDYQNAIKYYTLTFDNTHGWWLLQKRAICYSQLGLYDKAIQDFETILIKDRKIDILFEFAEVCLKGSFINKAKNILNEVINFSSDNKEEHIVKLLKFRNQPIKDKAKKLLREI